MKHTLKVSIVLLSMFLITQLIGLAVIDAYSPEVKTVFNETTKTYENVTIKQNIPFGMEPPEIEPKDSPSIVLSIIIAFIIAVSLILLLTRLRAALFIKLWFFFVVVIALSLAINAILLKFDISPYYAFILAVPLAFYKIFKRNIIVHNLTELFIYPGIAVVFVWALFFPTNPLLGIFLISILLILISVYDIYAVWHAGFMQKMAKFQIEHLKIFAGFLVPYAGKKTKEKIRLLREKYKNKNIPEKVLKTKKIKISLAILGGGDVIFPIIMAGIVMRALGFYQALTISIFATLSLLYLFMSARKSKIKAYPAMPFITVGCFVGLAVAWLLTYLSVF